MLNFINLCVVLDEFIEIYILIKNRRETYILNKISL